MSSDEDARSTERPPANDGVEVDESGPDIAAAILRAKTNASAGRYGPPSATAKINKFDLAQALALTTSEGEHMPSSSKPPRDDDAPFVGGEVEVVGEEHASVPPGSKPSKRPKASSLPPAPPIEEISARAVALGEAHASDEEDAIVRRPRSGNLVLVILGALVGLAVIAYVYVRTR